MRVVLPIGDNAECRSLLYDLVLAGWARADALRLPLDALGDPTTLVSRLDDELDADKSFAAFVGLVGGFARKREEYLCGVSCLVRVSPVASHSVG
jgi:hypothetical protein